MVLDWWASFLINPELSVVIHAVRNAKYCQGKHIIRCEIVRNLQLKFLRAIYLDVGEGIMLVVEDHSFIPKKLCCQLI